MIDVEEILSKMNLNQKINYDRVMQKMVQVWEKMSNGQPFSCMFAVPLQYLYPRIFDQVCRCDNLFCQF